MCTMKTDMGGAAGLLSAFECAVKLGCRQRLHAVCLSTPGLHAVSAGAGAAWLDGSGCAGAVHRRKRHRAAGLPQRRHPPLLLGEVRNPRSRVVLFAFVSCPRPPQQLCSECPRLLRVRAASPYQHLCYSSGVYAPRVRASEGFAMTAAGALRSTTPTRRAAW